MKVAIFDIETNGFLEELDRLHSLVIHGVASCHNHGDTADATIEEGLHLLAEADILIGHNILGFDLPAIRKVCPDFKLKDGAKVYDTLVLARLFWPDIKSKDFDRKEKGILPGNLIGSYSLNAFGFRLGILKDDYKGGFDEWNQEMQDYCVQDVAVTSALWGRVSPLIEKWGEDCVQLEQDVYDIVTNRQYAWGFRFDIEAAKQLYRDLATERNEIADDLQELFPPIWKADGLPVECKVNRKDLGYIKGAIRQPVKLVEFNPNSRFHIADRLIERHGWKPTEYNDDGSVKVDDTILNQLPYPEAKTLARYSLLKKAIDKLAEGKQGENKALMKNYDEARGIIKAGAITMGTPTGRFTHKVIANIPRASSPYGKEMRGLFTVRPGNKLVGCDAASLEMRCLAGYMSEFDGGKYNKVVLGEAGIKPHAVNAMALGWDDPKAPIYVDGKETTGYDTAKTWFYAFIYGGGDWKLGYSLGARGAHRKVAQAGKAAGDRMAQKIPALIKLKKLVEYKAKKRGYLVGIDGRKIFIRSEHAALNFLLQSAGAIVMKRAMLICDELLQAEGFVPFTVDPENGDFEFVLHYHDEMQIECREEIAETVAKLAEDSIRLAGEYYNFGCPLAGEADIGNNWAETH